MLKKYETREQFVAAAAMYLPKGIASIELATRLELGWRTHAQLHRLQAYPPPKAQRTPEEEAEAQTYLERARQAARDFKAVVPSTPFTNEQLQMGWLAGRARDERGFKR